MLKVLAVAAALLPALITTASADGRYAPSQYGSGYDGRSSSPPQGDYRRDRSDEALSYWQLRRVLRGQGFHLINIVERQRGAYVVLAEGPFGRTRLLTVHARTGVVIDIRPYRDWRRGGDDRREHRRDRGNDDGYNETGYGQGGSGQGGYGQGGSGQQGGYGSPYPGGSSRY